MTNQMQVFNNSEFGELGIVEIDGKPYFPARRCAEILGYRNPQEAIRNHCKGVSETLTMVQTGVKRDGCPALRETPIKIMPEGDLYRLIVRSKLPAAERFESWVFDEVLPAIRKHGAYMTAATIDKLLADPDFGIRLLTQLKEEQVKNAALTAKSEELAVQLNESEKFWTIMKFNQHFHMGWNMKACQCNGKTASAYSRQHGYEIKKCLTHDDRFEFTNSYPYEVLETLFLPRRLEVSV